MRLVQSFAQRELKRQKELYRELRRVTYVGLLHSILFYDLKPTIHRVMWPLEFQEERLFQIHPELQHYLLFHLHYIFFNFNIFFILLQKSLKLTAVTQVTQVHFTYQAVLKVLQIHGQTTFQRDILDQAQKRKMLGRLKLQKRLPKSFLMRGFRC